MRSKPRRTPPPRQCWTPDQVALLTRLYADTPTIEIARQLGFDVARVYKKAAAVGLKKSAAYMASVAACRMRRGDDVGKQTRFGKGHIPWNKGMKGLQIGGVETQFKKGHRSGRSAALYKPIGTERLSKEGYLERKVNDGMPMQNRWRAVHVIQWEAAHGPVPKGYVVAFRDGDKKNAALENLELVSRRELMRRNSSNTIYPKEVAQLVQLRGAITRQLNRRRKP